MNFNKWLSIFLHGTPEERKEKLLIKQARLMAKQDVLKQVVKSDDVYLHHIDELVEIQADLAEINLKLKFMGEE